MSRYLVTVATSTVYEVEAESDTEAVQEALEKTRTGWAEHVIDFTDGPMTISVLPKVHSEPKP